LDLGSWILSLFSPLPVHSIKKNIIFSKAIAKSYQKHSSSFFIGKTLKRALIKEAINRESGNRQQGVNFSGEDRNGTEGHEVRLNVNIIGGALSLKDFRRLVFQQI
jgi:hypothetical protein